MCDVLASACAFTASAAASCSIAARSSAVTSATRAALGSGGTLIAHPDYMRGVRALCDKYGILYIADEVMVGFGRTGRWFAIDHTQTVPDIIIMAKGKTMDFYNDQADIRDYWINGMKLVKFN